MPWYTAVGKKALGSSTGKEFAKTIGKQVGIGGALGGSGSLVQNATHEGDRFDLGDTINDMLFGAAIGGAGGTLGSRLGQSQMGRAVKGLGFLSKGAGYGGALIGPDWEPTKEKPVGSESGSLSPFGPPQPTGSSLADGILSLFSGASIGEAPNAPTMTFDDYMRSASLNKIADSQIAGEVNPLNRQITDIREDMGVDLDNNSTLGQEIANQIGQTGRENSMQARAIEDDTAQIAETANAAAQASLQAAGAAAGGNTHEAAQIAENVAERQAELAAQRISDAELLKRLGVNSGEAINEMAASEALQTGQNATKIRTSANDAITETRGKISDVRAKRPSILGSLSQGMMDTSIAKHQAGLGTYQAKLSAAKAKADTAMGAMSLEAEMGAAAGGGMKPAQMYDPSGLTVMNETSGHADQIPIFATWPKEFALQNGIPPETYDYWAAAVAAAKEQ